MINIYFGGKIRMKKFLIFLFFNIILFSNSFYLFSQDNFEIPVTPSKDQQLDNAVGFSRTLNSFKKDASSYAKLKAYINLLDSKGMKNLKKHPSYSRLGDIYMYGAIYLEREYKEDKIIELYKKALELRAEPNSNYSLALIYKNRYDNAVKKKDAVKEVEYGKMVYEYLNKYIILSGNKSAKYKKILNYFSSYK